jgi:ribonucleoside-diphosphate reductase beta chain
MTLAPGADPFALKAVEETDLQGIGSVDVDDVIEYVHEGARKHPTYLDLYRRYLKQRWDVYDLDFTQDRIDWQEKMTDEEREAFLLVASGFHHGERQVEVDLVPFMLGGTDDQKIYISSQIEDEARHTVFFDRFYREVIGLKGDTIPELLDASYQWVGETFVGPFGLLAAIADDLRLDPENVAKRVRYATLYMMWIEGVLALSVMKITLGFGRARNILPAYYSGFTATCRDEARHVQFGMRFLADALAADPTMEAEIHAALRTLFAMGGAVSRIENLEPIGWTVDQVGALMMEQLGRKLRILGLQLPEDLQSLLSLLQPTLTGG